MKTIEGQHKRFSDKGPFQIICDDDIYETASKMLWGQLGDYAVTHVEGTRVWFHMRVLEIVLGHEVPEGFDCLHVNGNSLDNRRANLRLVSHADNTRVNTRKQLYYRRVWHPEVRMLMHAGLRPMPSENAKRKGELI